MNVNYLTISILILANLKRLLNISIYIFYDYFFNSFYNFDINRIYKN